MLGLFVKTNLKTQAVAHVILFSSDLALPYETLIDDYCLRFQLEFNFRDAKPYWGLEDFMNISQVAVTNAANLSLFIVNLIERVLQDFRQPQDEVSVLDLKAHCRSAKYLEEPIKPLSETPDPVLLERIFSKIVGIGCIHALPTDPVFSSGGFFTRAHSNAEKRYWRLKRGFALPNAKKVSSNSKTLHLRADPVPI